MFCSTARGSGQNNFQINGIDASFGVSTSRQIGAPAAISFSSEPSPEQAQLG
jgi:hypothetical protein